MLNLAKQSDAIGSPLSQPDRRVHKKVHLHNDARARDLPELRWVRCAPTSASRENAPFGCSSPSMPPPPPDTGRCVALSSAISPSSWGRTIIRSQLVRSPKIHRMVRPIRSRSKRMRRTIRSIFGRRHPFFRPQLVPDVVGQQLVHWARLGTSRRDFVLRRRETA